jgi:hypothetical protein
LKIFSDSRAGGRAAGIQKTGMGSEMLIAMVERYIMPVEN